MLRPKEVCERLGITYTTLWTYVKQGKIKPVVLETGKWRFREEDVERLMGVVKKRKVVLYARVSSNKEKDELVRQVSFLQEKVKEYDLVITDVGSGLDMKRKGFQKLLRMVLDNEVSKVVIASRDRLLTFGFEVMEEVCGAHNCEVEVLEEDKTLGQELVEDLISALLSFSEKLYGVGSNKYEKVKECVKELKD
ncbi:IS607 family transposase [Metallosphaera tengchongensis]|uniref:IS607 family transposase n=1 Tax=Metallosphaera tengchongensis TaxID=1532350 RepID=A0A6N0NVF0_9CREN|nr:IS607 family transposase [Metallosphaera tengchongensis]QKQ99407.1 IS607 family transposase [Metallosphaera tengchongensis]